MCFSHLFSCLGRPCHYSWTGLQNTSWLLKHAWHQFRNTNHNYKHVEIKLRWHTSAVVFYLHNLESKNNMHAVVSDLTELHQANILSPIPATHVAISSSASGWVGASLGAPWWRTMTVSSPSCASPWPPLQHEGLKEMGDARGTRGVKEHRWERNLWPATGISLYEACREQSAKCFVYIYIFVWEGFVIDVETSAVCQNMCA